jgi:predicted membrane channel-forming protein YqfA (hemolysin III family)
MVQVGTKYYSQRFPRTVAKTRIIERFWHAFLNENHDKNQG